MLGLLLFSGATLAATRSPGTYQVRNGDNLSLIAYRFGVTVDELRKTNKLTSDVLQVGQKLRLDKPFHRQADIQWGQPCHRSGEVLRPFGPYKKKGIIMPSTGTDVTCAVGTAVSAPAHGIVRYLGHMDGFGTLVIIEHGGGFASVLSPLDPGAVAVTVGHAVLRGDHLGRTGPPPERNTPPYLHVELRKNDKAIKPDRLLD